MSLKIYQKKRNFNHTLEPRGKVNKKSSKYSFTVQQHAASHLHYDFRLELDGVLKSWAVPKGPCLDPTVKRLAVQVEDHPLNYGKFEGIIPAGEYGGGTVMLWDYGYWEPKSSLKKFSHGELIFYLYGSKLHGQWTLIQLKNDPKNWLLIKSKDGNAKPLKDYNILEKEPLSVSTQRSMAEITKGVSKKSLSRTSNKKLSIENPRLNAKRSSMPSKVSPELATLVDTAPSGQMWLHEIKFDGYRLICILKNKKIHFFTRHGLDWTKKFPNLCRAFEKLNLDNVILDGEVVVLDSEQRTDFQLLQNALKDKKSSPFIYYVFDILHYQNFDLSNLPLLQRKEVLRQVLQNSTQSGSIRYSEYVIGNGSDLFKNACKLSLEGIVSKQIESKYIQKRTKDWLKAKCDSRQEFVIIGFTKPQGSREYFGSLLLGYFSGKKLVYCGHVGTGFNTKSLREIAKILHPYIINESPAIGIPRDAIKDVTWVKPQILAEIKFSNWTQDNVLRHPTFKGLRIDKRASEAKREEKTTMKKIKSTSRITPSSAAQTNSNITHPDHILYPQQKITKLNIVQYYENIAEWMLPHIKDRPLSLIRCPSGIEKCFFQKHFSEGSMPSIYSIDIQEKSGVDKYLYLKNTTGLISLVQMNVLEMHTWGCHIDKIERPDLIVFDLDPGNDVDWKAVVNAAKRIKDLLENLNLQSFVKTSGGKGLHIYIPVQRRYSWDDIKAFANAVVNHLVAQHPNEYIGVMTKSKRTGKIFIDYFRNNRGSTTVAPYSTRARANAPVSTPLTWQELTPRIKPDTYTIKNIFQRLARLDTDPWEDYFKLKQSLKIKI